MVCPQIIVNENLKSSRPGIIELNASPGKTKKNPQLPNPGNRIPKPVHPIPAWASLSENHFKLSQFGQASPEFIS